MAMIRLQKYHKFINNCRFMSTLLSNLISKLSEELHNDRYIDCKSSLDYVTTKYFNF